MLLNVSETTKYIREMREKYRPGWQANRVAAQSLVAAEAALKAWLIKQINQQPTKGKTITFEL